MPRLQTVLMTCLALGLGAVVTAAPASASPELALGQGRRLSLDEGWRFLRGDLIVRSEKGPGGDIEITERSKDLESARTSLTTVAAPTRRER
ncbi:MAG: hypothetical protein LJF30_15230 [Acidobacteria bacterium]|jgi:hypothetical protein|nr:hypothetical protein [Acidobacteriota bacterium]